MAQNKKDRYDCLCLISGLCISFILNISEDAMSGGAKIPVGHFLFFLLVVFICTFVIAYQRLQNDQLCLLHRTDVFTSIVKAADITVKHEDKYSAKTSSVCCLPNSIIIGARKAGTRALINFLKIHPEVKAAANEVHFFDRDENFSRGLSWYASEMPELSANTRVLIEKSPYYFVDLKTPARIYSLNSSMRLVLVVRDPVRRVFSDQTQLSINSMGNILSLEEKILSDGVEIDPSAKILQPSFYAKYLTHWQKWFPPSSIHIVDGDALVKNNPFYEMKKLEQFLSLTPFFQQSSFVRNESKGFYCPVTRGSRIRCLGSTKGVKHIEFDEKLIIKLTSFFKPHNQQFFQLISRNFSWS